MKALKFCQWKYLPLHEAHPYWASFEISLSPDAMDVKAGIFAPSPHRSSHQKPHSTSQSAHAGSFYKPPPTGQTGQEASTLLDQQSAAVMRAVVLRGGSHRGFRHSILEGEDSTSSAHDGGARDSPSRHVSASGPLGSTRVVPINPSRTPASDTSGRSGDQHGMVSSVNKQDLGQPYEPVLIAMQSLAEEATMRAVDFDDSDDEGGREAARVEVLRVASHRAATAAAVAAAAESGALARALPRVQQSEATDLQPKASGNSVWW